MSQVDPEALKYLLGGLTIWHPYATHQLGDGFKRLDVAVGVPNRARVMTQERGKFRWILRVEDSLDGAVAFYNAFG